MHLLQVCNVGDVCGGTAACAWSITHALPQLQHTVACFSRPTPATRSAFAHCELQHLSRLSTGLVRRIDPDVVLLHNSPRSRVEARAEPLRIQYLHSRINPAPADVTVACSLWLRSQYPDKPVDGVLHQPVNGPEAASARGQQSPQRGAVGLVIGRLCTPIPQKWPRELVPFYARLARAHPRVDWEFVGCPRELQPELQLACLGRATCLPAEPTARRHLQRWDAMLYHHPTLTETFGRTVAEALQAGCVPIVDDRGGFREQFGPDAGFLCRSMVDFSAAIDRLHAAATLRTMSAAAIVAGRCFSGAAFANRFNALLHTVVGAV